MTNRPPSHRDVSVSALHPPLEPFRAAIEAIARPAWLLNAYELEAVSNLETHFLGGSPYVPAEIGWPNCGYCGQPLTFLWQINFSEFSRSDMFEEHGLFQFFYCWECFLLPMETKRLDDPDTDWNVPGLLATSIEKPEGICYRWYPGFDSKLAQTSQQISCPNEELIYGPPMRCKPQPILSLPDIFVDSNPVPEVSARLIENDSFNYRFTLQDDLGTVSQLGGYPDWVQNDDTPSCPTCGQQSAFVGAMGSGDTNVIWGDTGFWYIFACKATPECKGLDLPLGFEQTT